MCVYSILYAWIARATECGEMRGPTSSWAAAVKDAPAAMYTSCSWVAPGTLLGFFRGRMRKPQARKCVITSSLRICARSGYTSAPGFCRTAVCSATVLKHPDDRSRAGLRGLGFSESAVSPPSPRCRPLASPLEFQALRPCRKFKRFHMFNFFSRPAGGDSAYHGGELGGLLDPSVICTFKPSFSAHGFPGDRQPFCLRFCQ